ncbi:MAG: AMP-binding protein, partial [Nitrososphaerales archaeon]
MRVRDYNSVPSYLKEFSVKVPESFNWGFDVIDRLGSEEGSGTALVFANDEGDVRKYSFSEISKESSRIANLFAKRGLKKGDSVMLMLPNTPMLWLAVVALIKEGVVIVPSAPTLTAKDLEYRISAAEVKGVVTDADNAKKFGDV